MTEEERKEYARQERFIAKSLEPRMEAPKMDEGLKEQIRREYAEIDLDELLLLKPKGSRVDEESEERKGPAQNTEESKERQQPQLYTIEESKEQILGLFSQL